MTRKRETEGEKERGGGEGREREREREGGESVLNEYLVKIEKKGRESIAF